MLILKLEGISKKFGGIQAVTNCSFSVEEGKIVGLVGPNGAGKTTIFNLITGTLKPDGGSIYYKNQDITNVPAYKRVKLGIARSFQDVRALEDMTILENVLLACQSKYAESPILSLFHKKAAKEEEEKNIEKALDLIRYVGLEEKRNELAGNLSYAEQKLMILARLLATEAELLLLDEPASGLSPTTLKEFTKLIKDLSKKGKTIILVEHNITLVNEIVDEIVFLHNGDPIATGKPYEIAKDEKLREIYFGAS